MIKGCIFDLDGTLANTLESIAYAVNQGLEYFGYESRPVEEYKYYAGDGLKAAFRRALRRAGDTNGHCLEKGMPLVSQSLASEPLRRVKPYPGIEAMLMEMKRLPLSLGVLSNKPHRQAVQVVEALFGKDCFDYIQGQSDEIPPKPNPLGAGRMLCMMGVEPQECLYVGDTNTDMITGNRAGMYVVGVAWGFRPQKELEENGAKRIVHKPEELFRLIKEMNHPDRNCS